MRIHVRRRIFERTNTNETIREINEKSIYRSAVCRVAFQMMINIRQINS